MKTTAAIHVAKKQLGLDDDTYRAVLTKVTGKDSCGKMTEREQLRVLEHFRVQGFKPASTGGRKQLSGPFAKKLQALWIGAWNLGLVKNRDDAAMLAFVKRQTGIDHTRFLLNAADAAKAVEALKAWMARDGGVNWEVTSTDPDYVKPSGFRIAYAQYRRVFGQVPPLLSRFRESVEEPVGKPLEELRSESDWVPVMNAFGERVRAAKAVAA